MKIYLAAPFFSDSEQRLVRDIERLVKKCDHELYSPSRDGIILKKDDMGVNSEKVFNENIRAIDWADVVLVVIDGRDQGTIFECGVAYAKGKDIVGFSAQNFRMNVMLAESAKGFCNGLEGLEMYLISDNIKKYKGEIQ